MFNVSLFRSLRQHSTKNSRHIARRMKLKHVNPQLIINIYVCTCIFSRCEFREHCHCAKLPTHLFCVAQILVWKLWKLCLGSATFAEPREPVLSLYFPNRTVFRRINMTLCVVALWWFVRHSSVCQPTQVAPMRPPNSWHRDLAHLAQSANHAPCTRCEIVRKYTNAISVRLLQFIRQPEIYCTISLCAYKNKIIHCCILLLHIILFDSVQLQPIALTVTSPCFAVIINSRLHSKIPNAQANMHYSIANIQGKLAFRIACICAMTSEQRTHRVSHFNYDYLFVA